MNHHTPRSTSRSARPELDFVELRRARELRDRFPASAGRRRRRPAKHLWLRRGLLLIALSCLGLYGYVHAERAWAEHRSKAWLESQARTDSRTLPSPISAPAPRSQAPHTDRGAATSTASPYAPSTPRFQLSEGDPVGRVEIPTLAVEAAVEHGNSTDVLRRAVGHLPGTALPGEGGNVVLAGHRDSFFRGLRNAARGQEITLTTPQGDFVYRIDGLRIVGPRDVEVIAPTDDERLTLITCYPFDYVGPAPRRLIVTAVPVHSSRSPHTTTT